MNCKRQCAEKILLDLTSYLPIGEIGKVLLMVMRELFVMRKGEGAVVGWRSSGVWIVG
jgi:hypothetical protein